MYITGIYHIKEKKNEFLCKGVSIYEDDALCLAAYCPTDAEFSQKFASCYVEQGDIYNAFDGMFEVAYVDKKTNTFHIFADITSFNMDMYYTVYKNCLYYSNDLKEVLRLSGRKREFHYEVAHAFLQNGFLLGEETLVKDVYKIKIGHELLVEDGKVEQRRYPIQFKEVSIEDAKETLISTIQDCILAYRKEEGKLCIPLSRGFDSNMVLHTLRKQDTRIIEAFTVGGKRGNNEISSVEQIVAHTKDVNLHSVTIGSDYAEVLPDIVWRLNGCVYESGIFLDYALSNMAHNFGAKYLITGAGSDETQFIHYLDNLNAIATGIKNTNTQMYYHSDPYAFANKVYLKKNSVLLNSFGVDGMYPFKNRKFVEVAHTLENIQKTHKTYYKEEMKKQLPPEVYEVLKTQGGTTTVGAIYTGDDLLRIKEKLEKTEFLKTLKQHETTMHMPKETYRIYMEDRLKYMVNRYVLRRTVEKDSDAPLRQLYLYVFYQLFVSGKYDDLFEQEGITIKTSDLL
ncbi:MAG: hypothetical protein J6D29_01200 [Solobacterium sp.]|nr:hypothetical protein [Solobacterium sp.]